MMNFTLVWIVLVSVFLWVGNVLITKILSKRLPWREYGNVRFFWHLFLGLIYLSVVLNTSYYMLKVFLTEDPPTGGQVVVMNVYGVVIFIPVFSIYFGLLFLKSWRRSALESEKFQKESIKAQLESLKSHLDPHFLFNNLNILSSLIQNDKKRSSEFLDKFSEVYRLILKSKSEDLIPLSEELKFIESYIYLLETRFSDTISVSINIPDSKQDWFLPPMVLQMLIENAIKHNNITEKKPLKIEVFVQGIYVLVQNSLNPKPKSNAAWTGSGLKNIENRYQYYSTNPVKITKTDDLFIVSIPLLNPSE